MSDIKQTKDGKLIETDRIAPITERNNLTFYSDKNKNMAGLVLDQKNGKAHFPNDVEVPGAVHNLVEALDKKLNKKIDDELKSIADGYQETIEEYKKKYDDLKASYDRLQTSYSGLEKQIESLNEHYEVIDTEIEWNGFHHIFKYETGKRFVINIALKATIPGEDWNYHIMFYDVVYNGKEVKILSNYPYGYSDVPEKDLIDKLYPDGGTITVKNRAEAGNMNKRPMKLVGLITKYVW